MLIEVDRLRSNQKWSVAIFFYNYFLAISEIDSLSKPLYLEKIKGKSKFENITNLLFDYMKLKMLY